MNGHNHWRRLRLVDNHSKPGRGKHEPFEQESGSSTFVETIAACSAGCLDIPTPLPQTMKAQFVGDFGSVHGIGKILFVRENEKKGITELILVEHALELLAGLGNTLTIIGINYEYDSLSVLEVYTCQYDRTGRPGMIQCLQRGRILSCPPTSQTVKLMFLYSTVSTLKPRDGQFMFCPDLKENVGGCLPMVGIVVTGLEGMLVKIIKGLGRARYRFLPISTCIWQRVSMVHSKRGKRRMVTESWFSQLHRDQPSKFASLHANSQHRVLEQKTGRTAIPFFPNKPDNSFETTIS